MNIGFDKDEIAQLRAECEEEQSPYILVEDEENLSDTQEFVHFQFIGTYEGKECIYDALLTTLEFEYETKLFEMALERLSKQIGKDEDDIDPEKYEDELYELMDEIEDEDELKVSEKVDVDDDFEYGVGVEAQLNVPLITHETIVEFIEKFNSNTLELDPTLYSFAESDEDND